ncbi:MAG: hypothetical protein JWP67_403 [Mucilaginibacter sp.]|jgi:hypothetical protein|nr:hypothetical protein [Mucilaginibacter sp.]
MVLVGKSESSEGRKCFKSYNDAFFLPALLTFQLADFKISYIFAE